MDPAVIAEGAEAVLPVRQPRGSAGRPSLAASANERLEIHPGLWAGLRPGAHRRGHGARRQPRRGRRSLIEEYAEIGIEHFILSGQPHLEEAYWVGEGVLPELRRRGRLGAATPDLRVPALA